MEKDKMFIRGPYLKTLIPELEKKIDLLSKINEELVNQINDYKKKEEESQNRT